MKRRSIVAGFVVFVLLVISVPMVAQPAYSCYEGCTPGFWKQDQHFQYWPAQVCVGDTPADGVWTFYKPVAACSLFGGVLVDLGASPQDFLVRNLFDMGCLLDGGILDLNGDGMDDTLLDALSYQGGDDTAGKAQILMRAAVAGVLNGMTMLHHPPSSIIQKAENAIEKACVTGNPNTMLYWGTFLDDQNNQVCVFSP
jgi:hypothetical protein